MHFIRETMKLFSQISWQPTAFFSYIYISLLRLPAQLTNLWPVN